MSSGEGPNPILLGLTEAAAIAAPLYWASTDASTASTQVTQATELTLIRVNAPFSSRAQPRLLSCWRAAL